MSKVFREVIIKECFDVFPSEDWEWVSVGLGGGLIIGESKFLDLKVSYNIQLNKISVIFNSTEEQAPGLVKEDEVVSIKDGLFKIKEKLTYFNVTNALEEIQIILKKYNLNLKAENDCDEYGDWYPSLNFVDKNLKSYKLFNAYSDLSMHSQEIKSEVKYKLLETNKN